MQHYPNQGPRRSGKVLAGMVLLAVGAILLLKNIGYFFPEWLFTWPMLLIVIGLFVGFKHNFRNPGGLILIAIGALFLAENFYPDITFRKFIWPAVIILLGLWMIFGRSRRRNFVDSTELEKSAENAALNATYSPNPTPSESAQYYDAANQEDYLDMTSVFGGTKKIILSKNFKGGEVVTIMGGAELNLIQADIQGRAILDVTQIMGGTKIIVPSNWDVKTEMAVAILGGIDDKRIIPPGGVDSSKVLIIKGTSILGGIDIRSY